jgi:hypothetical protein
MEYVIVLVVLFVVVLVISAPLRRAASPAAPESPSVAAQVAEEDLIELEAAREAKYREIRDAELDHQTGKLSDADFTAVDRTLRAEAIEILRKLDKARAAGPEPAPERAAEPAPGAESPPRGAESPPPGSESPPSGADAAAS